ncbi:MAG: DNA-processing protein DprA [Pseudomonadota bacterium]|nr:DNA-processing protein DprA [Pseudomonadota bacterium]
MLRDELLRAWWRLSRLPGVGNVTLNEIRSQLDHPAALLSCTAEQLIAMGLKPAAAQRWAQDRSLDDGFQQLQQWRQHNRCGVMLAGIAPYPEALASLRDAPLFLYYHGDLQALQQPMIAMVGSRNPTPYGLEWAQTTAAELAAAGLTVVSGLALGVDGAAHHGAVRGGRTIAVLGSGPDVIYPQRHLGLAQMVMQSGLLLAEFPPGTQPQPAHFPSRNRIISGMSLGVVVVEAALKSGSLITARLAAEQGREVFALPGAVTNPLSHGCHQLIRDGACLVQSAADILTELALQPAGSGAGSQVAGQQTELPLQPEAAAQVPSLVTHIDYTATSTDVIAIRSALSIPQLLPQLLDLELQGWLMQVPGGYMRLK